MKKRTLFGFLRKKQEPIRVSVYGITAGEYNRIVRELESEFQEAADRQRPDTKEPSAYMKGLLFALKLLASVKTHVVGVEQ